MVRAGGTPLPSAVVTFHRIDPRTQRAVGVYATRTNAAGRYLLQNLPPGPYVVLVDRDGRRLYQNRFSVPSFDILFDIAW